MSRTLLRAALLSLLLPAALTPMVVGGSASAAVQPCVISYAGAGGQISPKGTAESHSLSGFDFVIPDARVVTDLDLSVDVSHPDAGNLTMSLLGPMSVNLLPNSMLLNKGSISGAMEGQYRFDDDAATSKPQGLNLAPGTYLPHSPLSNVEVPPTAGKWMFWVLNHGQSVGTVRSWSLTVTYATCDSDGDGAEDKTDNCPLLANHDQGDRDGDGRGDACDDDRDGDAVPNASDGCPDQGVASASGCPVEQRKARLQANRKRQKLVVRVGSYYAECSANTPGTLWQVRKGPDVKIASFQADASGRATLRSPRRKGQYYVTVAANYVPGVVECGAAQSKSVKVKPAKRKRKRTK